jgi:hypothetical protein
MVPWQAWVVYAFFGGLIIGVTAGVLIGLSSKDKK